MEDNTNISAIINALTVIRKEWAKHTECYDCPFFTGDRCNIKGSDPDKWELTSNYIWRAFK